MKFVRYRNWLRYEAYLFFSSCLMMILTFSIFSLYSNGPILCIFLQVAVVPFWNSARYE